MSSIENPSMYARKLWLLPLSLVVALVAFWALSASPVFAQPNDEGIILVDKQDNIEMVIGVTTKVKITIQNVAPVKRLKITSFTDAACSSLVLDPATQDGGNDGIMELSDTVWNYTCTLRPSTTDYINTAIVNALLVDSGNAPVTDSDSSNVSVYSYGVDVDKSGPASVNEGVPFVDFTITVRNTGPNPIDTNQNGTPYKKNLSINDAKCDSLTGPAGDVGSTGILSPDGDITDGDLDDDGGAEIWTYTCRVNSPIGDKLENTVVVSAVDTQGNNYAASDSATVEILNPGLTLVKSPNKPTVVVGEVVTWTFAVYNTGETTLTPGATPVRDDLGPSVCPAPVPANQVDTMIRFVDGDTNGNGALNPGEVWSYECARKYSNPGIKEDRARANFGLTDEDTSQVEVILPGIQIEKMPFIAYVLQGKDANFTVKVTNLGQGNLINVMVEDAICTNANADGKLTQYTGDDGDGILEPDNTATTTVNEAETWTYSCVVENVQADDTNVAVVTAKDISGNTLSDTTTANIKMINPKINIEKTLLKTITDGTLAEDDIPLQGEKVVFNLRVTTAGNAELSTVVVTDPMCDANTLTGPVISGPPLPANVGDGDNRLDPGEIWDYQCSVDNVTGDFTNIATVTALQANINETVSDDDTLEVDVRAPGLQLDKEPPFQTIREGQPYTWTLKLRNTGQSDLLPDLGPFGLADPLCSGPIIFEGGDNNDPNVLNADNPATPNVDEREEWTFTCNGPILATFLQDEIINTAVAQFQDGNGNTVTDIERATVEVIRNIIDVEKSANPKIVVSGGTTKFTFQVRNFSNENLTSVKVVDDMCPGDMATYRTGDDGDNALEPSEVWTFDCTSAPLTTDIDNYAEVTAKQPNGNVVSDTDNTSVQVLNAKINVNKTADRLMVQQGESVDFVIEVMNTGSLQLKDVIPVDDHCPDLAGPTGDTLANGRLDPNETWIYTCTVSNVQNSFVNNVTVTAKEVGSNLGVSDSDWVDVTVIRPSINLIKTANQSTVQQGGTAYFTIVINNGGTTNLTGVNPVDLLCNLVVLSKGNSNDILEVGETWVYSCAVPNVQSATGTFVNVASVTANGGASASDDASVIVINTPPPGNPGIDVEKTPDSQVVAKNSNVTFGISVSNSGDVALNPVSVTDPLCTLVPVSLGNGNATLDVGETWTYTCTVNKVKANLTNTASASGTSAAGQTVSDSDSATVTIAGTKIKLEKSPKTQTIVKGSNATFLVTLNNPTAENLTNVVLSDPQCTTLTRQADAPGNNDAVLNSGETWRWSCTITNVQKSFTNKAKVTVIRPSGKKLTANASAKIIVKTSSQIRVTTSPEDVTALRGSNVPLSILVTNIGKGNLVNVTVSHSACAAAPTLVNKGNGDDKLASGETWTFACTVSNIQSEVSAAAVATATDEATGTVEEADALLDIEIFNEADEEADEATDEAAEAPAFKIFTPLITR